MITKTSGRASGIGAKVVVYGPPGIGKSTLVATMPGAVVIDPNFGTSRIDVEERYDIDTWKDMESVLDRLENPKNLVIDEFGELEQRLYQEISKDEGVAAIGDIPYGGGYREAANRLKNLIAETDSFVEGGGNVFFVLHDTCKTHSNPEGKDYDRHVLRMRPALADILCSSADAVLYCKYDNDVKVERQGFSEKRTGVTGDRVMCGEYSAAYDAKNRFNMRPQEPMETGRLLGFIEASSMSKEALVEELEDHPLFKESMSTAGLRQLYAHRKAEQ